MHHEPCLDPSALHRPAPRFSMTDHDESSDCSQNHTAISPFKGIELFGAEDVVLIPNASITRGAFGGVSLAVHATQCRVIVVKQFFQPTYGTSKQPAPEIKNEIDALRRLSSHENIATLLAVFPSSDQSFLSAAFDYSPTDLALSLEWRRKCFLPLLSMPVIQTIAKDLFSALRHMHALGILHCDIKPANLLVSPTGTIQVCDFGLTQPIHAPTDNGVQPSPHGLCTLHYRPPELLLGCFPCDPAVDMFSAGLVLCELLLGRPLLAGRNVLDQLSRVFALLGTPTDESWLTASNTPDYSKLHLAPVPRKSWKIVLPRASEGHLLEELLEQLVTLDPQKRLSSPQAMEHPWVSRASADRTLLLEELVPEQLEEPLLLSMEGPTSRQAAQSIVQRLAARRRQFLSTLVPSIRE